MTVHDDRWQPIDTAPKEGTRVLLVDMGSPEPEVNIGRRLGGWHTIPEAYASHATHWRPVPPLPGLPPPTGVSMTITDQEFAESCDNREAMYRDELHRDPIDPNNPAHQVHITYMDRLGRGRWPVDYITARQDGYTHLEAMQIERVRIRAAAGLPPTEGLPPRRSPAMPQPPPALPGVQREDQASTRAAVLYPQLLEANTYESCVEFTQRVLELLGPAWGHVGKTAGEGQAVPRGFKMVTVRGTDGKPYDITGVSHDAIKHRLSGQVVDILGNAAANSDPDPARHGLATPTWGLVPPEEWRVGNPFIPAVPVRS